LSALIQRQRAFEELSSSRRHLRAMMDALPDLVFSVDRGGVLRYVKSNPDRDLLVSPSEADGRRLEEIFDADLAAMLHRSALEALDQRTVTSCQYELTLPGRGLQHFEVRFAAHSEHEVIALVRNNTEQVLARQVLEDHRGRLRRLAEQQTLAEQALRQRVAAEVHDGLAQELAMARLLVSRAVREPSAVSSLSLAAEVLDGAVRHINEIIVEISPPSLRELGLIAAVRTAGRRLAECHQVGFAIEVIGRYERLSPEREAVLYWATRELLINVVKHAGASQMFVEVLPEPGILHISVSDDGRGLPEISSSGFGLFNTRERLRLFGGDLLLIPLDRGTRVVLSLPVGNS